MNDAKCYFVTKICSILFPFRSFFLKQGANVVSSDVPNCSYKATNIEQYHQYLGTSVHCVRGVQGLHQVVGERRLHAMHWTVDQERLKFERVLVINVVKEDIFKVSGYLFGIARQSQS